MKDLAGFGGIAFFLLVVLFSPASAQVIEPRLTEDGKTLILLDEIVEPRDKRQPLIALEFPRDLGIRHIRVGGKGVTPPSSVDLRCGSNTWTITRSEVVRVQDLVYAFFSVESKIVDTALTWPECHVVVVGVGIPIPRDLLWAVWVDPSQGETAPRLLTGEVVSVIDGHTIRVRIEGREENVRYIGVKAPRAHDAATGHEPGGLEAATVNRFLVEGKIVRLELDARERDPYGQLLAYVYAADRMVNAELVKRGYARVMTAPPNLRYETVLIQLQRDAREQKRGLWASR